MDNTPTLSVIMPVYNSGEYLNAAISSILSQTFSDLELLLIDDKSTDGSLEVCKKFEVSDTRVHVIALKENSGAATARNVGLTKVSGKYVAFMDADDTLDNYAYETAINSLEQNPAQAVMFGIVEEYYDESKTLKYEKAVAPKAGLYKTARELRTHVIEFEESLLYGYPVNKLYSMEHMRAEKIVFPDMALQEDILFNIDYFMNINSLNVLDITPYHYAKRGVGSVTSKYLPQYFTWHRMRILKLCEQFKKWNMLDDKTKAVLGNKYNRFIISACERNLDKQSGMNRNARQKWLEDIYIDKLFLELKDYAKGGGKMADLFSKLLKNRHTRTFLALVRTVRFVKIHFPMLFAKLK